jgi:hypothetical protein
VVAIRSRKKISERRGHFPACSFVPGTVVFGEQVLLADLRHDDRQVVLVDVGVVGVDDVLHPLGQPAHDIQMLGVGKAADADGGGQQADIGFQAAAGDAVDLQGAGKQAQALEDADKGRLGDEAEVDRGKQLFQIDIGQALQAEGQAEGVELAFAVAAVHRRDVDGDVPLVVDLLLGLELLRAEDDLLQMLELVEQGVEAVDGVVGLQHPEQMRQLRESRHWWRDAADSGSRAGSGCI